MADTAGGMAGGGTPLRARLAQAGFASRSLRVYGRKVHVLSGGEGPAIVLLHGLGGLAEEVLMPFLPLRGRFRLEAVDRPGYGLSNPMPEADMAPDRQALWLEATLAALGHRRVTLLAHSLAAGPALWLALRRPDLLEGLVLVSPFCRPTREAAMPLLRLAAAPAAGALLRPFLPALAPGLARLRLGAAFRPDEVPPYMASLPFAAMAQPSAVMAMAAELRAFNTAMRPMARRLRGLRVRTVILAGDRDTVASWRRHALWAAKRIPDSSGACLRGAGHMAHHVRPAMVAAALESARRTGGRSAFRRL